METRSPKAHVYFAILLKLLLDALLRGRNQRSIEGNMGNNIGRHVALRYREMGASLCYCCWETHTSREGYVQGCTMEHKANPDRRMLLWVMLRIYNVQRKNKGWGSDKENCASVEAYGTAATHYALCKCALLYLVPLLTFTQCFWICVPILRPEVNF